MDDENGMQHSDFRIGTVFTCGESIYRCTDVGTRTIVAIRIDPVEIGTRRADGTVTTERLITAEAARQGWFNGPPYAVAEIVFDECDLEGCLPAGS